MLLTQNLGDSKTHYIPLMWEGNSFSPGGSWVLIFTAKARAEDPDSAALIQKTSTAGISVSASTASVALVPADTVDLSAATLVCDVQAQHVSTGEVRTVAEDIKLKLKRDITRETETSIPIVTTEPPVPFEVSVTEAAVLAALGYTPANAADLAALTYGSADPNGTVTALYLGQLCKASTAWWQWNGTAWIPRCTDSGEPIAYNATLATYRKLTVSGADGSEIVTISAL